MKKVTPLQQFKAELSKLTDTQREDLLFALIAFLRFHQSHRLHEVIEDIALERLFQKP